MRYSSLLLVSTLLLSGVLHAKKPEKVSPEWAEKWREDLSFVLEKLPEAHANLYHRTSREELESAVAQFGARVPSMTHYEIIVELARIIASVEDGHTRLTIPQNPGIDFFQGHSKTPPPDHPQMVFRQYPIRLYLYSDGLFVQRVGEGNARLSGARVLRIGKMSAEEAIEAVAPIVQRDNELQLEHLLPTRLVMPEVLAARGVVEDMERAPFVLETTAGETITVGLVPVPRGETVDWVDARSGSKRPTPLYLRDPSDNFWFEYLENARAVYFQYNEVYDKEDESIPDLCHLLRREDGRGAINWGGFPARADLPVRPLSRVARELASALLSDRKSYAEGRPLADLASDLDVAAVLLDDVVGIGQPHPHPHPRILLAEHDLEGFGELLGGNSSPGVRDLDKDVGIIGRGLDGDRALAVERVGSVDEECHEALVELTGIALDLGKFRQLFPDFHPLRQLGP